MSQRPADPRAPGDTAPSSGAATLTARVHAIVASLPRGTCVSYGEVAAEAGHPGAARAVGSIMRRSTGLPWWRVIRADGTLPKGDDQVRRLQDEGVSIINGRVRMAGR